MKITRQCHNQYLAKAEEFRKASCLLPLPADAGTEWPVMKAGSGEPQRATDYTNSSKVMTNKANKLTLTISTMALAFLHALPDAAWAQAQVGISQLRAPDGIPNPALSVDNVGNVGIGTTNPTSKLDVRGHLTIDSGGDAFVYTGTGSAELNRYLEVLNAPGWQSASGLKVGGVLVADSYSYAYPDKNDLIVKGNVGIGTANPLRKFHVEGDSYVSGRLGVGISFPWKTFQVAGSQTIHSGWDNWLELWKTDIVPNTAWALHTPNPAWSNPSRLEFGHYNGHEWKWAQLVLSEDRVGIGTTEPQARLDVNGQIRSTTLFLTSDRNAKADFRSVSSREVLRKVVGLPLSTWHYTNAPGVRHMGPMAQDFKAAFPDLGSDDKHISTVDADGAAFASIQALHALVKEQDLEIAALKRQMSELKTELAGVKNSVTDRLVALERAMSKNTLQASFPPRPPR